MHTEPTTYDHQDLFSDAAALQALGLTALTDAGSAWADAASRIGGETATFLVKRAKEDLKTQARMMQCTEFAEFQRIQAEHIQTALRDYTNAATSLTGLGLPLFGIGKGIATRHTPV